MAAIPPQRVRRIGLFLCLVAGGLLIAHSINAFVAEALYVIPIQSVGSIDQSTGSSLLASYSPTQAVEDVRSSGLFHLPAAPQGGIASSDRREPSGAPVRASLGLAARVRLMGVVLGDQRLAIIEELASKQQMLYHVHDEVLDLGEVSEIRRNGILVRHGNLEELLELALLENPAVHDGSSGVAPSAAPRTSTAGVPLRKVIDRREVEQAMSDLPKLLSQARAVPHMVNGAVNGFRLDYIAPTSFYEKIGVRTGDVLQRVNGVDIRDPGTMLNVLQQLKHEQIVKLDMLRNNQRSTITYELR